MNTADYLKISPCENRSLFRHTVLLPEIAPRYAQQPLVIQMNCPISMQTDLMQLRSAYLLPKRYPST